MVYVIIVVYCLGWGIVGPAAQALATRAVPANEQGLLQGGLASLTTATGIFGPPVAAGLFGYFIGPNAPFHFPGVSFFIGAVLFLVSLLMARRAGIRAALGGTPVANQPR
jgi:DHA1 family tetracycline resistance protein-like MFS transporter